jgi:hypothetical protein
MQRLRDESFYAWVIINLWIDSDQTDVQFSRHSAGNSAGWNWNILSNE